MKIIKIIEQMITTVVLALFFVCECNTCNAFFLGFTYSGHGAGEKETDRDEKKGLYDFTECNNIYSIF